LNGACSAWVGVLSFRGRGVAIAPDAVGER